MKKLSTALLAVALAGLLPTGAGSALAAQKAKPKGLHVVPADNPYVVGDPVDPRVLHPAPGFQERGFDRGWLEKTARPKIPAEVFDELEALVPRRAVPISLPEPGMNPYAATSVSGNIMVVEGNSSLVVNTQGGLGFNHNDGMFDIVNEVLGRLGDNFDFITVWTTFADPNVAAYYFPLRQDVEGLGECNFNTGETFGCIFDQTNGLRLQGVVFMNSISTWQQWDRDFDGTTYALDDFNSALYSTLGQEIAHRWGSGLRFVDPRSGNVSKKLLGRDGSHWAAYVDTDASVMDGWDWASPDANGRFDLVNDMNIFSTLDLYTMGALPVAAARPFFFIDGARFQENDGLGINGDSIPGDAVLSFGLPSVALMESLGIDLGATGEKVDLTIQDIVDAEGNRCPDPDHTQKSFRQAIVLVTRPGETAAQAQDDAEDLEVVAQTWERWWLQNTGNALTLCTELDQECETASAELSGGTLVSEAGDFIERGTTITIRTFAKATGDAMTNARLVLKLEGSGADQASLVEETIQIGDIAEDAEVEVPVEVTFNDDYNCASNTVVVADLVSDNAQTVREEFRLFPGHSTIFIENFGSKDDFKVNLDEQDNNSVGAMERVDLELTCDMTKRTPERDMTPGSRGAYVTGAGTELDGDSSLWSPEIDLADTVDPILTFDFWLEGENGDSIKAELSEDGETFVEAFEDKQQLHGWGQARVRVKDSFDGKIPAQLVVRWIFNGKGQLEGGIDNVRVLDPSGQCRAIAQGFCGCSTDGSASPQASLLAMAGLLGLRVLRRRRNARA